jgi:hypothetical protein
MSSPSRDQVLDPARAGARREGRPTWIKRTDVHGACPERSEGLGTGMLRLVIIGRDRRNGCKQ